MLISAWFALVLWLNRGGRTSNYIVGRFPGDHGSDTTSAPILSNLGSQWFYLLEGLLDLGAAAVLVFEKNVKAFFGK